MATEPPPGGERKTITALFCDVVGSTELADRLDPEEVDRILRAYHRIARHRIETYGGRVEKFIGDGVVGVFGVPSAHEDDPERAVRAALRLIDEVAATDLAIHVRIGICTGETLVRTDVEPESGEGFVTGDTMNIAARLQGHAPIDGVAVAEPTQRACKGAFRWDDLGLLALKGRSEPMQTWRPIATIAQSAEDASAEATPFVGRDHELQALARIQARSATASTLEAVTIVAEPGMGKSRLVRELRRLVDRLPDVVTWRSGRCLPYGDGIAFWPLAEIVAAHAGIRETDDQAVVSVGLDDALAGVDPSVRAWMKDRLGPLVGLQPSATVAQETESFAAWRLFLEHVAQSGPLVLLVEDLHWADAAFVRFLLYLTSTSSGVPILLLVTTRPEIEERHPAWLEHAQPDAVMDLGRLTDESLQALVRAALPDATAEVVATVLERASGSPLYAEQLSAMLVNQGVDTATQLDEATIPETIHALLAARIDALPLALKAALLDASVIGRTFWSGAVAALGERDVATVEPMLAELARRGFSRPAYPSSMEGEAEYTFWHALVRDVAYGTLPRYARATRHRAAAAWIADRSAGAAGRTAEIVAEHYWRAFELASASGMTDELPAIQDALADALLAAAESTKGTSPARSADHARRALGLLERDDPRRADVLVALGLALVGAGETTAALDVLEQARTLLLVRGAAAAAVIAVPMAAVLADAGQADRAAAIRAEARAALADPPGPALLAVMAAQAMAAVRVGDYDAGIRLAQETVDLARHLDLQPPPAALMALGGDVNFAQAIAVADATGDFAVASRARVNRIIHFRGRADAWLSRMDDAVEFSRAHGIESVSARGARAYFAFNFLGRSEGVVEELNQLVARARAVGDQFSALLAHSSLIEVCAMRGDPVGPLDDLVADWAAVGGSGMEWTLAVVAIASGDRASAAPLLTAFLDAGEQGDQPWLFVDYCLRAGDRVTAERLVADVLQAAPPHEHPDEDTQALQGAVEDAVTGRLAEDSGDPAGATAPLRRAWQTFAEYGWDLPAATVEGWLARCLMAQGMEEEAGRHLAGARHVAKRMGLSPWLAELDALAAGSPPADGD